ncbi:ribonuclease H-like domain-containing protein [Tanacetum coccineum]|uniref:Ribonuclease H-like domain-containing protein n=1 Tax=Tanacetum coccineum TaxID=301880 RepID=A0ABQ4WPB3_9ASTR
MFAFSKDLFMGLNRPEGPGFRDLRLMLLGLGFIIVDIITSLHAEFSMTDLGSLNSFLGIFMTRNASGMFQSQQKYATEVLDRADMLNCKPCRTPVAVYFLPWTTREHSSLLISCMDLTVLGAWHLGPSWITALFLYRRHLLCLLGCGLGGYPTYSCSTSGYCVFSWQLSSSWSSKRNLLSFSILYCGMSIGCCFAVADDKLLGYLLYGFYNVPSRYQYADIFTKGLPTSLFDEFRTVLRSFSSQLSTARGC